MVRITPVNFHTSAHADRLAVHLRSIISNLFYVLVEAHDFKGQGTKDAMMGHIKDLIENLQELSRASRRLPTTVPLDLIQYVEDKRNPDVYKRQIVELVMQYNQLQSGRAQAFASFRDILGREMMSAIPDIRDDVKMVLEASGGSVAQ
jgi:mediator of RNA polymerase II transcription subunit 10